MKCSIFFIGNKVISPNQFGFKPGDTSVNQLLSIAHKIYKTFDEGREVRGILLDISKSSFQVDSNGISESLLSRLHDFLRDRKQCAVFNGQTPHGKMLLLVWLKVPLLVLYCFNLYKYSL